MESRNKVIIAILVIAVIVAGVMATYYGIGARNTDAKIADLENKLDEANKQVETTKAELAKSNSKINDVKEALGVSEETTTTDTSKQVTYINTSNCINPRKADGNSKVDYKIYGFGSLTTNSSNTYYYCNVEESGAYVSKMENGTEKEKNKLENIDKKIIFAGEYFYTSVDSCFMFVLEDGTVNYIDVGRDITEKGNYKTTKIDGVSNVVSIIQGSDGNNGVALLIRDDGKFYDSLQAISKMKGE